MTDSTALRTISITCHWLAAAIVVVALCTVGTCSDSVKFVLEWTPPAEPPLDLDIMEAKCTDALHELEEIRPEQRAEVLYRRACIRGERHKFKECRKDLEAALLLSPDNLDVQRQLGLSLSYEPERREDQARAEDLATSMIEIFPGAYQGHLLRAECLGRAGDDLGAMLYLDEAVRLAPDSVECRLRRAFASNNLGILEKARTDLDKVKLLPPTFESYSGGVNLLDGILHYREGNYESAAPFLRRGIVVRKRCHRDGQAIHYLALWYSYVMTGRGASAEELAARMRETLPTMAEGHAIGALMAADRGNLDTALEMARKAVKIESQGAFTRGTLGKVLMERGEFGASAQVFKDLLESRKKKQFVETDISLRLALIYASAPDALVRDRDSAKRLIENCLAVEGPGLEPYILLIQSCSEAEAGEFDAAKMNVASCLKLKGIDDNLRELAESMNELYMKGQPFRLSIGVGGFKLPCQKRLKGVAYVP